MLGKNNEIKIWDLVKQMCSKEIQCEPYLNLDFLVNPIKFFLRKWN
jgi:hypothetical protein